MVKPDFDLNKAKIAMHQRLHDEGRWEQYVALRDQLKKDGAHQQEAWKIAAKSFPRPDGTLEIDVPDNVPTIAPEAMPKPTNQQYSNKTTAELAKAAKAALDEPKKMLADKARQILGKECHPNELVAWLVNYSAIPVDEIEPDEFPASGAVKMLQYFQLSDGRFSELMTLWGKTIASQTKIDTGPGFSDDGRQTTMLDTFIESEQRLAEPEKEPEPADAW